MIFICNGIPDKPDLAKMINIISLDTALPDVFRKIVRLLQ